MNNVTISGSVRLIDNCLRFGNMEDNYDLTLNKKAQLETEVRFEDLNLSMPEKMSDHICLQNYARVHKLWTI